jgi:hypothetical protein
MNDTLVSSVDDVNEYIGYLAFLDVLGFRSIFAAANNSAALRDYVDKVDRAVQTDKNDGVQYVIFSDSVIVSSVRDDDDSFLRIRAKALKIKKHE